MARKFVTHAAPPKAPDANSETFDLSSFTAIRAEDADAIARIKAGLVDFYQPADSEEFFAVERIALARHSLLRTYRIEGGLLTYGLQKALQTPGTPQILDDPEGTGEPPATTGQENSFWMAAGFCHANSLSHWQFFLRYQAQAERLYRRAVEEFERLRRHRGRVPEQPIVDPPPKPAAERPPKSEPERSLTPELKKPPTPPTPRQQFVAIPASSQPSAVPSRQARSVSHRHRPSRASPVIHRTTVLPAAARAVKTGSPNVLLGPAPCH